MLKGRMSVIVSFSLQARYCFVTAGMNGCCWIWYNFVPKLFVCQNELCIYSFFWSFVSYFKVAFNKILLSSFSCDLFCLILLVEKTLLISK